MSFPQETIERTLADLRLTIEEDGWRLRDQEQEQLSIAYQLFLIDELRLKAKNEGERDDWDLEASFLACQQERCLQDMERLREELQRNTALFALAKQSKYRID